MNIGSQAKIYIRPIQADLDVNPVEDLDNQIKDTCSICNMDFPINNLRQHVQMCSGESSTNVSHSAATNETAIVISDNRDNVDELPDLDLDDVAQIFTENDKEEVLQKDNEIDNLVNECVSYCKTQNVSDPVSILKIFQKMVVTGRPLEVDEASRTTGLDGDTNFIIVDRYNIVKTALEEVASLCDMRKCLEVQFYSEGAVDYGGPRKEFFALVLQQIQKEYFDPVREWSDDYETVGKIMALSAVQNGKLPRVMSSELVEELFTSPSPRNFVKDLQKGLNSLGLCKLAHEMPTVVHLFTPVQQPTLTLKMMTCILKPNFSEEGSNRRKEEKNVYSGFVKYMREAASGRREGVTLGSVLKFATGTDEEPVLGFVLQPTISFAQNVSYIPTANTCVNQLNLTIPAESSEMPSQDELFRLYDYAFCNTYFGLQ